MKKIKTMIKELGLIEKPIEELIIKKESIKKPYELKDKVKFITLNVKKYQTYFEDSNKYWWKREYKLIGLKI